MILEILQKIQVFRMKYFKKVCYKTLYSQIKFGCMFQNRICSFILTLFEFVLEKMIQEWNRLGNVLA